MRARALKQRACMRLSADCGISPQPAGCVLLVETFIKNQ